VDLAQAQAATGELKPWGVGTAQLRDGRRAVILPAGGELIELTTGKTAVVVRRSARSPSAMRSDDV
jgi:hypothetical protein